MTIDKAKLRALAQTAKSSGAEWSDLVIDTERMYSAEFRLIQLYEFATPDVLLALLAEIDQLNQSPAQQVVQSAASAIASAIAKDVNGCLEKGLFDQIDQLKAEIARSTEREIHQLAEIEALRKDLESHKRMLLAAACDIGAIGQALGADENDDGSEIEGLAQDLRQKAECVDDCAHLIRKLVHCRGQLAANETLAEKALDYLKRKGLQDSPMRDEPKGIEPDLDTPADLAEMRKDAERYRWLRHGHGGFVEVVEWIGPHATGMIGEDLDALVDALMSKEVSHD